MDEEELKNELGAMIGPRFHAPNVSEAQRCELVEALRGCAIAILDVFSHEHHPLRFAHVLRAAARSSDRFANLAKRIGATEAAAEAGETTQRLEALANDAECGGAPRTSSFFALWW